MALRFNTIMRALIASGESVPSFYFNFSNPSNVTLGAAQARGTITSTQNANITASVSPSRTTGVAPLYVNFDATATTSTLSTNPSHELFYATDFGDYSAGVWANGVQSSGLTSKNAGYGPVTGHVYETPGTYTVQMVVTDGVNTATKTGTIVVQDPNTVYAGTDTICISHSGNFTGAPSGAQQVNTAGNTDMYAAWNTYKASNKRILFCKADSWTVSASMQMTSITGMTVGGYGTGVARAFGSGTLVNVDASLATTGSIFLTNAGCSDIRICDMKVLGGPQSVSGISLLNTITQFTASKMEFRGVTGGFNAPPGQGVSHITFDQHCMYECVVDQLYGEPFTDTPRKIATTTSGSSVFTSAGHPFAVGRIVKFITGGITPPTPLALDTDYYILASGFSSGAFQLSTTANGAAITITQTGSFMVPYKTLNGGIGCFVGFTRGGMLGCYIDTCNKGEQTVRFPFLDRAHINNNYFARPNQSKNIVKIHSFIYDQLPLYSEKFILSANVIDGRGGYDFGGTTSAGVTITETGNCSIICGNGGAGGYERVRNGIIENNYTYGGRGQQKQTWFAYVFCSRMTIRNNIADFMQGSDGSAFTPTYASPTSGFINLGHSSPDPTVDVQVYNNTLYSNLGNAVNTLVWIREGTGDFAGQVCERIHVKNNILYAPYVHAFWKNLFVYNPDNIVLDVSNNTTDQSINPGFVATPPVLLTDWRTTEGWTIDSGATVPVLSDFNQATRVGGTYDLGAVLP